LILNVESGRYGFPSEITDDPLLHLVIPRPETFKNAEERRLMYVAITRAKRATYLFTKSSRVSVFIKELAELKRVKSTQGLKRAKPCPSCDTGELRRINGQYGAFYGCSNYPDCTFSEPVKCPKCHIGKLKLKTSQYGKFMACSQYPGCDYKENM